MLNINSMEEQISSMLQLVKDPQRKSAIKQHKFEPYQGKNGRED